MSLYRPWVQYNVSGEAMWCGAWHESYSDAEGELAAMDRSVRRRCAPPADDDAHYYGDKGIAEYDPNTRPISELVAEWDEQHTEYDELLGWVK